MNNKILIQVYKKIKPLIKMRLSEFEAVWEKGENAVLSELVSVF